MRICCLKSMSILCTKYIYSSFGHQQGHFNTYGHLSAMSRYFSNSANPFQSKGFAYYNIGYLLRRDALVEADTALGYSQY